jgi:hypothetical protein
MPLIYIAPAPVLFSELLYSIAEPTYEPEKLSCHAGSSAWGADPHRSYADPTVNLILLIGAPAPVLMAPDPYEGYICLLLRLRQFLFSTGSRLCGSSAGASTQCGSGSPHLYYTYATIGQ